MSYDIMVYRIVSDFGYYMHDVEYVYEQSRKP